MTRFAALLVAACIAAASVPADARVIYKLVDRKGQVTYVDQRPKAFDGEVTEIVVPDTPATAVAPAPLPAKPAASESPAKGVTDINSQRRDAREKLQLALDRARARLEAAKKALADGGDPQDDELQVIIQRFDASKDRPDAAGPRGNCTRVPTDNGGSLWSCPVMTPGEKFRERQKSLEEAVLAAEAEVDAAEKAFRRGTD
ncbi:hypothetical protein BWI17_01160 [Betaproteobacteria bacterium GR16-43]|nr:hypothetical protein BWI17_01160 [Betaproteobacteria bacterium GR16-43]